MTTPHFTPFFKNLNHHISHEPIEINIEATINKEKIHLTNRKSRYSILEQTNDRSKNHPDFFFDDIHAHSVKLNEFFLACVKIRIYLIWFHCFYFSFKNPKLILIHLIIHFKNNEFVFRISSLFLNAVLFFLFFFNLLFYT